MLQKVKTQSSNVPIEITSGHLNTVFISPVSEATVVDGRHVNVKYIAENGDETVIIENIHTQLLKHTPDPRFLFLDLGSIYLHNNGKLSITISGTEVQWNIYKLSNALRPPYFNVKKAINSMELKNVLSVHVRHLEQKNVDFIDLRLVSSYQTLNYHRDTFVIMDGSYETKVFQSHTGIPVDVNIELNTPIDGDTIYPDGFYTQIVFPVGIVNKELFRNISLANLIMKEYENSELLQATALVRSGMGYSSKYYQKQLNTMQV